jgi:hypothetical protein
MAPSVPELDPLELVLPELDPPELVLPELDSPDPASGLLPVSSSRELDEQEENATRSTSAASEPVRESECRMNGVPFVPRFGRWNRRIARDWRCTAQGVARASYR